MGNVWKEKKLYKKQKKNEKPINNINIFLKFWKDNTTLKLITNIFRGTIELYPIV